MGEREMRAGREMMDAPGPLWRTLAAAAGVTGDRQRAAEALAEATRLQPELSIEWIESYHPIVRDADRAVYVEGLRAAGLT